MDVILPDGTIAQWPGSRPPFPQTTFWFRGKLFRVERWHARMHKGRFTDVAIAMPEHPVTVPEDEGICEDRRRRELEATGVQP